MRDIGSRAPHLKAMGNPKALGSRRSGRAGEPAAGDSMGAPESLDDVPHRPRLPSYPPVDPTDRLPDLYGSLSRTFGIMAGAGAGPPVRVRDARRGDLTGIREIYAHHVRHGLASFEETPPDLAEVTRRFDRCGASLSRGQAQNRRS